MASETYFVRIRGKVSGPFDVATLQKLVRRGMLSRAHQISSDRTTWSQAGEFVDLFPGPMGRYTSPDESSSQTELAVAGDTAADYVEPEPLPLAQPSYAARPAASPNYSTAPIPMEPPAYVVPQAYYQALPPAPVYRRSTEPSHRGMAIASMVLALIGLLLFGFITGVIAIVLAGIALAGMGRTGNKDGHGMAVTGLVIGIIDVVWGFFWFAAFMAILSAG